MPAFSYKGSSTAFLAVYCSVVATVPYFGAVEVKRNKRQCNSSLLNRYHEIAIPLLGSDVKSMSLVLSKYTRGG